MAADPLLPLHPCIGAQSKHMVISEARTSERPRKDHFLLGRRVEPESVCTLDVHVSHYTVSSCELLHSQPVVQPVGCAPFLSGLNPGFLGAIR